MAGETKTVHVALSERSYEIAIGVDNLDSIDAFLNDRATISHAVIITDTNVAPLYLNATQTALARTIPRVDAIQVPAGEPSKSVAQADQIWQQMLDLSADRKSVVVALGGGVIGDLAGFIAASFARGIDLFQIPTTLLAQVDSSVGGKVGINLPGAKNMVGAFWQPRGVLIDIEVLQSLPEREYRAGLAEVVKYGVILDPDFFAYLEEHTSEINARQPEVLQQIVARCCELKAYVVANDERETTGLRAVLNYGHTFCHAIETVTGYGEFLHGEAVAIGMLCASRLAERLGRIEANLTQRQDALLAQLGLATDMPAVSHDALIAAMQRDKKVEHGRLRFVLPDRLGHVELVGDIAETDVRQSL